MSLYELEIAKKVTQGATELIRTKFLNDVGIKSTIGKDIKTKADIAAHEYILNKLTKTGIPIVSEEGDNVPFNLSNHQWIVDPIDGTLNFSRGFETSGVSIALWDRGTPILGVVQHLFLIRFFLPL